MIDNRSIGRAIKILECLSGESLCLSSAEVARRCGIHRATAHRLLMVLEDYGFVHKNPKTKKFSTGFFLHTLGRPSHVIKAVQHHAQPFMKKMADELQVVTCLGMLHGQQLYIYDSYSYNDINSPISKGTSYKAHTCSMGLALLAFLEEEELNFFYRDYLIPGGSGSKCINDNLAKQLQQVRNRHVITLRDSSMGAVSVAAPLINPYQRATCSIGIVGENYQLSAAKIASYENYVSQVAECITQFFLRPSEVKALSVSSI